jgi:hypothetical protein
LVVYAARYRFSAKPPVPQDVDVLHQDIVL